MIASVTTRQISRCSFHTIANGTKTIFHHLRTDSQGDDFNCCGVEASQLHPNCLPIDIPRDDYFFSRFGRTCMEFKRSLSGQRPHCALGTYQFYCLVNESFSAFRCRKRRHVCYLNLINCIKSNILITFTPSTSLHVNQRWSLDADHKIFVCVSGGQWRVKKENRPQTTKKIRNVSFLTIAKLNEQKQESLTCPNFLPLYSSSISLSHHPCHS